MYGSGGGGGGSTALSASSGAMGGNAQNRGAEFMDLLTNLSLKEANVKKTQAETRKIEEETFWLGKEKLAGINNLTQDVENKKAVESLTKVQERIAKQKAEVDKIKARKKPKSSSK